MTARIVTKDEAQTDIAEESSKFTTGVIIVVSALIGIWGFACLIGGLTASGPAGLMKGYISALTGM